MVELRNFTIEDAEELFRRHPVGTSLDETRKTIRAWSSKQFQGCYFEMFAVVHESQLVGMITLWGRTEKIAQIGPEIFPEFKRRGFGREALSLCLQMAREKGYSIAVHQVREDNIASIALHRSLGFDTDGYIYRNRHDNKVLVFVKVL